MNRDVHAADGQRLAHHGRGGELFVIILVNMLLKAVTLGIYHFWAKTRVRNYFWSQTSIDGERLQYTGTGGELFVGFLKAMGIVVLVVVAFVALSSLFAASALGPLLGLAVLPAVPVAIGAIRYSIWRYILTRTQYRGIRFGLGGSAWQYGLQWLGWGLLTALTLGIAKPWMSMGLKRYRINNMAFGSRRFSFDGQGGDMIATWLGCLLLAIPTLGLSMLWYALAENRYTASRMRLGDDVGFALDLDFLPFLGLVITNMLLLIVTLGLAMPWVMVRTARFFAQRVAIDGQPDYAAIRQEQERAEATGEGFGEAFDVGIA